MHWLQHTYSTLAPRLGHLFWALHALILLGLSPWLVFAWSQNMMWTTHWGLVAAYPVVIAAVFAYARLSSTRVGFVFWPLLAIDCALVSWMVYLTGGIQSNHYLLFFAITPYIAFYQGLRAGVPAALAVSLAYLAVCVTLGGTSVLPDYGFRAVMLVLFTTAMGFASKFLRQSEGRLLNALDKLNERTSELERTHAHLQTIYETSRSLTELMSVDNVVDRLLEIARSVLDYPIFEIYTWNPKARVLSLNGRVDHLETTRFYKPQQVELTNTMQRALNLDQVVSVRDHHQGRSSMGGNPQRSELIVPMVSEGKTVGLLSAKSPKAGAFSNHDERILSILAASTALSLINADLHERVERMTIVDELTEVANYRHFRSRLEDERRRSVRYSQPLSLVMVDIDWFKRLNDQHGHETGNVALRGLAQVINGCIRDVDILARYGGEEFIIILPQTGLTEARVIGERIRRQVEQTKFGVGADGQPIRMTVSIGISCFPENGRPEDELVQTVDRALYHAKGKGKNLVCTT
jgi:diguanylate cyclase (GGDEF)-like protein